MISKRANLIDDGQHTGQVLKVRAEEKGYGSPRGRSRVDTKELALWQREASRATRFYFHTSSLVP